MTTRSSACTVIVDVRCLQDHNYAGRGVGRTALALLRHAPRGKSRIRLAGLADPSMPPLSDEARDVLDVIYPNAYAAGLGGEPEYPLACFALLSPMTHDPLFAARLLNDPRLLSVAFAHDFIPRRFPERYLPETAHRLNYAIALRWLARCNLFATNSRSTADELCALLGVAAGQVVVTGCPLHPMFEDVKNAAESRPDRHVLVVGGGDPRKNPQVVIRAHARSAAMQRGAGIPLVISGNYSSDEVQGFRAIATEARGRAELLEVPGHLPDMELLKTYRRALAVISPSRDEGFSLPVVEGMAAGALCLASDIPAHRELVGDPSLRFAPDDDNSLAAALDRMMEDSQWRKAALIRQSAVWPQFRAQDVAERFWSAILRTRGVPRSASVGSIGILRNRRPRVALLSPLPPDRSGVADYTAATCAELGRLVDLHVFSETKGPDDVPGAASVRPITGLPSLASSFDRVVHVVGNSHFHLRIFEILRRYGGACIAHDARMLGFYRALLGQERALAVASKELGRSVAEAELNLWLADESKLEALFLGEIAESTSPTIVHSPITARLFNERYSIAPVFLPFSIYRSWTAQELSPAARASARARLGMQTGEVAIVTFGFVHTSKAPEECIWALEVLRGWGIPASLHFVGDTNHTPDGGASLRTLAANLGLAGHLRFAEKFVSEQAYRDYLVGADLAIQLRTYGLGGLSGALLDCVAAGLPTVANAGLAASVGVPASYTRAIPDALSPLLLAEALADLLEAGLSAARPEAERRAFSEERSLASYARGLCRAMALDAAAGAFEPREGMAAA